MRCLSTISVITPQMLRDVDGTLEFFRSLESKLVGFNVEETEGIHEESELYSSFTKETIASFFGRLAALQRDAPGLRVRELDAMRRNLQAPPDGEILRSTNQA